MANEVTHFEIMTKNPTKVQKFYKDVFDWKIMVAPNMDGYGLVSREKGGRGIGGGIAGIMPGAKQMVTFYIEVSDPKAFLDKAVKQGGKIVMPPKTIPGVITFGLFSDPDGNVIGVAKDETGASLDKRHRPGKMD